MYQANKRLDSLEQIRCRGGGLSLSDEIWLVDTARRAIEALGKIEAAAVNGVSNVAGFALDEIEDDCK